MYLHVGYAGRRYPKVIHDLRQSLRLRILQLRVAFAGAEVQASRVSDAGPAPADRDSDAKDALDAAAGSPDTPAERAGTPQRAFATPVWWAAGTRTGSARPGLSSQLHRMDSDGCLRHPAWQDCDPTRPQPRYTGTDGRFAPWVRGTRRTGAGLAAEAAVAGRDIAEFAGPLPRPRRHGRVPAYRGSPRSPCPGRVRLAGGPTHSQTGCRTGAPAGS